MIGKFTDLSIDLETLGTEPGCVITQIGLSAFDANSFNGETHNTVSALIHVHPQNCIDLGMHVSWSTISWWLIQDQAAREKMAKATGNLLIGACQETTSFIRDNCGPRVKAWGNGATFDVSLLSEAYRVAGLPVPWEFRDVRDIRTLYDLKPCANIVRPKPVVEHDAMYDAVAQAHLVQLCMKEINK